MHDLQFSDSVRPTQARVLGLMMLPYSIGHEIILLSQRNPLLFDQQFFDKLEFSEQRLAVVRAALVCYKGWRQSFVPEKNLLLWGWKNRKANISLEIAEFRNYRTAGSASPPSPSKEDYEIANGLQNEESGREFGGSHLARLLAYVSVISKSMGYDTPYDFPFGLANFMYLSDLEIAGNCRIENSREAQVREEMAEHRRAIKEEKKCQP